MTRLIDADELKKAMWEAKGHYPAFSDVTLQSIYKVIDNAPTVETKTTADCIIAYGDGYETARRLSERPQGEWIFISRHCWKCPYCQELTNEGKNFCSNCGADMRGDKEC